MRSSSTAGVVAIVAVALGIGVAGCGSDGEKAESTSAEQTSETSATPEQAAPEMTIAEYIQQNGIVETPVLPGDPGAPVIELPVPRGWGRLATMPERAYDAVIVTDPAAGGDRPRIITYVTKLTGNVDPAKIMEYAPKEIQTLEGYEGPKVGSPTKLGETDATQIGGAYMKNGQKRAIGQMTAVIPAADGVYMIQLNGSAPGQPEKVQALAAGSAEIAMGAKINPVA
ncbi:Probable lipoprotein LpqN [Mycolicibacterium rutilum]|uniref:Probable lipoprotein LpqN n=1 Tax=Mycolicibacterium rutilum TaxID=370526 RepID=A0A1H6IEJ2_MYCRU|nr:LpqN/LpqT family lipoprotein [Mycolicibacterium rutilum]SEH46290.1 Probable lipoprotein LpqN [Mycolicibacterium rutilum]